MSGYPDSETVFDSIHPGVAEVPERLPRHLKRLDRSGSNLNNRSLLEDAIRRVALPRLLAARASQNAISQTAPSGINSRDVEQLLSHVTTSDHHIAEAAIMVLALRGISRADMLLHLFTPVAVRLHEEWLKDAVTFADVTLAVSRLRRLLGSSAMPQPPVCAASLSGRILISQLPGDSHGLGPAIVEDFFRNALWDTATLAPASEADLVDRVRREAFDVLALSVSQGSNLSSLALLIRQLRRESANSHLAIIVGGQPLAANPGIWTRTGADATAPDAACAVLVANTLLQTMLREP
jgi:MerR family transcriptional regulator, light-induced transcriptional regulator